MRSLKNISVFKIVLLSLISIIINKIVVYLLFSLIFILFYRKELIFFLLTTSIIFLLNNFRFNFIKIGIVDYKVYNYYVVEQFFYKSKIYSDDLNIGDIILIDEYHDTKLESDLKKNIYYINDSFKTISSFYPKFFIHEIINNFDKETIIVLNKLIFNINDYDDSTYNLGYGLASYYLLNEIRKKSNKICVLFIFLYSIFFTFDIKFILIIINIFLTKNKYTKQNKLGIKILVISLINIHLLKNYSILLPLLFSFYQIYDLSISFLPYILLVEALFFNEINIISTLIFIYMKRFRVFSIVFSLALLLFPFIETIFIRYISLYSFINSINLSIRGTIGIFSLSILYLIFNRFKTNAIIQSLLIILFLFLPLNCLIPYISFIDVGQGDSALISNSLNKNVVLIDTGSKYNYYKLKKYLFRKGIYNIDCLIISHDDEDHNGNIDSLNKDFNIKDTIYVGKDIINDKYSLKYFFLGEYDNDNDNSLVYLYEKDNFKILFTGDISALVEKEFIRLYGNIDIDVLKASHHGSNTGNSEYFIGSLLPEYCIISTSGQYNHPHHNTINNLEKYLVKYYITKDDKTISFYICKYFKLIHTDNSEFVIIS